MTQYTIHPMVLGTKVFDKGMMTYQHGYGEPFTIPIYSWLLKGGDKVVLVDTGEMHPIISADREEAIGGPIRTFSQALSDHGLSPEDVDIILHTHLHNDHCENDYLCANARIYVHEKELEHIHSPHPLDYRYLEDYIEDVEEAGQIVALSEDKDILPGIRMIHTPAHTEGGMSILVETLKGPALICGFCTILENLYPPKEIRAMEMEVIPPGTHMNAHTSYDILLRAKGMAEHVFPLHEPSYASVDVLP